MPEATALTRFVVLSTQRSGTTWTIEMLNSHPRVVGYGELLVEGGRGTPRRGAQDCIFWETHRNGLAPGDRQQDERALLVNYLDDVLTPRPGVDAVGFKLMYGQAGAYPAVRDYVAERGMTVLHLVRRNLLDIVLSKNAAVRRGMFSAEKGRLVPPVEMRLNVPRLVERLESREREIHEGRQQFADAGVRIIDLVYEDLVDGTTPFRGVLDALGVRDPDAPLATPMRKLNTQSHAEMIANYDEVRRELDGTRFASMLR